MKVRFILSFLIISAVISINYLFSDSSAMSAETKEFNAANNILFVDDCTPALSSGGMSTCSPPSGENVTWIGDSYTACSEEEIWQKLPNIDFGEKITGDVDSCYSYSRVGKFPWRGEKSGMAILKQIVSDNKLRPYLIFALGTNDEGFDYDSYTSYLNELASLVGNTKVILVTAATADGSNYDEPNRAKKDFAASHNNFYVADWAAVAKEEYFSSDQYKVHPYSNGGLETWIDTIISALPSEICETDGTYKSTNYSFSDEQLKGIIAVAKQENGGNIASLKNELSIMANLFEYYKKDTPKTSDNFVNYILHGGQFSDASTAKYNDSAAISEVSAEQFAIGKSILVEGKRTLPPEILEQSTLDNISSITLNGQEVDKNTKSNYVRSQTTINQSTNLENPSWIFFDWANPDGTNLTSNGTDGTGNPLGYLSGNPPSASASVVNPGNASGGSSISSNGSVSLNSASELVNYKGDPIFDEFELSKIKEFQPLYEEAVKGTTVTWQFLAVTHNRESTFSRINPRTEKSNCPAQGIFQLYTECLSGQYADLFEIGKEVSDEEFIQQARLAAKGIEEDARNLNVDINSENGIKKLLFSYNGMATVYKNQALALGFSQEEANNGEGSPYVMNRMDAQRDPTVEPTRSNGTWGQIKRDNGPIEYPANEDFGAYVQYIALTGGNWASTGGLSDANGCLVNPTDTISGNGGELIASTARSLAWPDENHDNSVYPAFISAAQKLGRGERDYCPYYRAETGRDWPGNSLSSTDRTQLDYSQDCGVFVSTVIQTTGIDPEFPDSGTSLLESHMENSSLWQEISNDGTINNLKPGDVFVWNQNGGEGANGHTFIYVGNNETASASLCNRTGNIRSFDKEDNPGKYRVFRSTVQANSSGGTIGSFDEGLKAIEKQINAKVGAAVSAPGNKEGIKVQIGGSWYGGRAWSTIKVPLAIAATQKNASTGTVANPYNSSETCSGPLSVAINTAITQSNNCGAWWLWEALGGDNSSAAESVTSVLRAGGDTVTNVTSQGDGRSLTSGMTDWSLVDQAIFASNMTSISNSSNVLSEMKTHNADDGRNGLNLYTAMSKGGWGNDITRQFGIIKLPNGQCSAVAIGTNAGSSKFSILDDIIEVIISHSSDIPSGTCPSGL